QSLRRLGPRAAPTLVQVVESPHQSVRQAEETALIDLGGDAVQVLLDAMTPVNAARHIVWLERLDPQYWHLRGASNPVVETARRVKQSLLTLRDARSSQEVKEAIQNVGELGPMAAPAVPALIERLADNEGYVRSAAAR